ncbi:DUF433 domain-containing protein [Glacieibacterium frigidum]|uniref:DUF433 domain-containing protein n=1 Tax=Glacieibacterium frigidum TaxID=2593303 RepID=A0A552UJ41_9SPHN|nr:DUF433 domain-containing protein [Glacieibacterium frigidum]TRW18205.1 DUF433 domain-containing protein [Glacieibacterium frigidum]
MMDRIVSTPGVRSGKPCIRGTRITVVDMLEYMAGGDTIPDLLEDFTELSREDLLACLAYAAEQLNHEQSIAAE